MEYLVATKWEVKLYRVKHPKGLDGWFVKDGLICFYYDGTTSDRVIRFTFNKDEVVFIEEIENDQPELREGSN